MSYAANIETMNKINFSALFRIPGINKPKLKRSEKNVKNEIQRLEETIQDFKNVSSIYENPDFATELKIKKFAYEIENIERAIAELKKH